MEEPSELTPSRRGGPGADGGRVGQGGHGREATARARVLLAPATFALVRGGALDEGRRAGRGADGRHPGGQAHAPS